MRRGNDRCRPGDGALFDIVGRSARPAETTEAKSQRAWNEASARAAGESEAGYGSRLGVCENEARGGVSPISAFTRVFDALWARRQSTGAKRSHVPEMSQRDSRLAIDTKPGARQLRTTSTEQRA
jgi:hypothetical protein